MSRRLDCFCIYWLCDRLQAIPRAIPNFKKRT
jgi:hypothetical protein